MKGGAGQEGASLAPTKGLKSTRSGHTAATANATTQPAGRPARRQINLSKTGLKGGLEHSTSYKIFVPLCPMNFQLLLVFFLAFNFVHYRTS